MAIPKDKNMYERIKKSVYSEIPTHSAYRSGQIVKRYKMAYKKKYNSSDAYEGKKKTNKGLDRWFKEDWRTQDNKKEYDSKDDIFRPTKKITKETPKTMSELSKKDIKKAQRKKQTKGRVDKY
jgi:hypothetical protein